VSVEHRCASNFTGTSCHPADDQILNSTDHSLGSVVRIVGRGALMRGTNLTDDDIDASDSYVQSPLSHRRALHSWDSRPEFAASNVFCAHYDSTSGLV